jgi:hypothetical protein
VTTLIAIERPKEKGQYYVADGLSSKYHFSCPTIFLPYLFKVIQCKNNGDLQMLFIPRSVHFFNGKNVTVANDLDLPLILMEEAAEVYQSVLPAGEKVSCDSGGTGMGSRSNHSVSIGLQTMYSHQQHEARFSMLPHSKPHVTTVKQYPTTLISSIQIAYSYISNLLDKHSMNDNHPFEISHDTSENGIETSVRLQLRDELRRHLFSYNNDPKINTNIHNDTMFESCTVQPTGALGFHQDVMNCDRMDKTLALFVPIMNNKHTSTSGDYDKLNCMSYLFYTRKSVGDYACKLSNIHKFVEDTSKCGLARLCVKSLMHVGGVMDYQCTLFEMNESFHKTALKLENEEDHKCLDVKEQCGLSCFKHGAPFDKMGYYSVFVNIFLCFYYKGICTTIDDSISLCIFFGCICNGTSSLAAAWYSLYEVEGGAVKWMKKKQHETKLFDLLVKLERNRSSDKLKKDGSVSIGNCKLPRFQYANYADTLIENAESIH